LMVYGARLSYYGMSLWGVPLFILGTVFVMLMFYFDGLYLFCIGSARTGSLPSER